MLYKLFEGGWRILHKRRKRRKSGKKRSPVKQRQPQTHKKTPKEHQKTGHWVIYYTNAARNKHSVPSGLVPEYFEPLSRDLRLQSAAQRHSNYMAESGRYGHRGRKGSSVGTRTKRAGYEYSYVGENIYKYPVERDRKKLAKKLVDGWMKSPGHRLNILDSDYTEIGVGIAERKGYVYVTQNFGKHG